MKTDLETQLMMEHPLSPDLADEVKGAGVKTILFHVHDDDAVMDRLELALSLGRASGAHVHCLHVTPIGAYTIVDCYGGTFVNDDIVRTIAEESAKLQKRIETHLELEDVAWDYEEITGELVPNIVRCAALADIVVIGREPCDRELGGPAITLLGDLLAQMRTPLLVTGDDASWFDPFAPALISWNGSYEAANAVRGGLPLLKMASKVTVVQFTEDGDRRFPSTSLVQYLSRHGIFAELESRTTAAPINEALVQYAERNGAGIIVMGGYGHSRVGEFLFGGVTRALLKNCSLPLLIAH